jgi:hypothetical protein
MFCPDCRQDLDDVPVDDPCPQCGGLRRGAHVSGEAVLVAVAAVAGTVTIGYSLAPGLTYQWRSIQGHLAHLRAQYKGSETPGNVEAEETVHALFLALYHLYDWLHQDRAVPTLDERTVRAFVDQHQISLGVARDYANTRKHMKRKASARIAQITSINSGPNGYAVTIGHGPGDSPLSALARVDALTLAEECERDWRDLLTRHGMPIAS